MKKLTKILSLVLALCLCLCFAACGSQEATPTDTLSLIHI